MSYNLLKGKRGIIFGALNEQSIAWKVAEKAVKEGATITLSNTPVAVRMGEVSALSEKLNCEVIPADATSVEDLENVFKRSMEVLGGPVDFVLHSIGMSPNVRKKRTYDDLDYDMLEKTLDISAVSFHKMIQAAKKLNAIADYGSILALSYVAAQRTFYGYNDMADYGLHTQKGCMDCVGIPAFCGLQVHIFVCGECLADGNRESIFYL